MGQQVHGALVEVLGLGVLLLGRSGVGKSECALELVQRGHRLVADDVVRLRVDRLEGDRARVIGHAPELIRHYMELRGVGLIRVPDLFGEHSVLDESPIDVCCRLEPWREGSRYDRIGLDRETQTLLGVEVPSLELPVRPAGNMATLVEVAVRDQRERNRGNNAARRLDDRLRGRATSPSSAGQRATRTAHRGDADDVEGEA
jgi:HPr kinase/phosphorylase